ncbi:PREDICTED: vicilin-like seed storage protein At2g18540 [Tarenaya hassleriana]|uniref:vicilin-like seed storage protein At2g18540 n=1 Tax=Tarenaya hassleriana TaxID=28532 RepID=UPI00053C97CD|nr:PREDICTED: vicilin-like seed storage protein At2g18540 [Tarenaya hassleriana]
MSRCYPFPPPGYARNEIRDEALIESIKREEEKARKERKERKREKKEKKRKERESGAEGSKNHSHKRRHKDNDTKENKKVSDNCRRVDNETELLEKSCLTDERDNQTASQNSCDSTINCNERPKQSLPLDDNHNTSESIIRIRLPVKRQKDPEVLTSKDEQPYSPRGRIVASQPPPRELVDQPCSISASVAPQHVLSLSEESSRSHITTRFSKEKMPSRSHREQPEVEPSKEKPCSVMEETARASSLCTICPPKVAVQFLNLIENWSPEPAGSDLSDSEDQEWWVMRTNSRNNGAGRIQVSSLNTSQGSSLKQWPGARFLPGTDIHALPYTVPF